MKYFTPCWFENVCLPVPEYEERFKAICKKLPDAIDEFFSLHDARIIRIQHIEKGYAQDDIVLFLDTKHSYTIAVFRIKANSRTNGTNRYSHCGKPNERLPELHREGYRLFEPCVCEGSP